MERPTPTNSIKDATYSENTRPTRDCGSKRCRNPIERKRISAG